ncbi:MAG: peptidylprolyl isomerase [Kofleriaceae bacterium]
MIRTSRWLVVIALVACGSHGAPAPVAPAAPPVAVKPPEPPPEPVVVEDKDLDSKDILARDELAPVATVAHVLLAWKDLAPAYNGELDPRAAKRSNAEAAALAQTLAAKIAADPSAITLLMQEHSEDPGSLSGEPYEVKPDSPFVPEFKNLALRLHEQEVGIVRTKYGYHVMLRVPPPLPDPLESAAILQRPAQPGPVQVQHILIGWRDAPAARTDHADPRALARTKAEADKLATELLGKVKAKADMAKLMKQYSEDPGSKDTGKPYAVSDEAPLVEPFKNLALRLKLGEAGLVRSPFGWHVMKRVPPPPPDALESAAILARKPRTALAKVKHILLGWVDVHAEDERGKTRDRKTLERLVKATVAKLRAKAAIEPLMKELSEDPGSAVTGTSYDVTPEAGLVAPFKNLALRLEVGEVGVVKTEYGIHIIQRVK